MRAIGKTNWPPKMEERPDPFITRSLIGHSLDVAHVAREMLIRGVSRARVGHLCGFSLTDVHVDRLAFWVGLHDFGKANNWFQRKLIDRSKKASHLIEAFALLYQHPDGEGLFQAVELWFDHPSEMMQVLIGHHGGPIEEGRIEDAYHAVQPLWEATDVRAPIEDVRDLFSALGRAFPLAHDPAPAFPSVTRNYHLSHLLAGLVQAADKMASADFRLVGPDDRPALARQLLDTLGWVDWGDLAAPIMSEALRPIQEEVSLLPLDHLLKIEAPTGDGKSEAAILWMVRLVQAGLVDGLFFAVPTRSAAAELFKRIDTIVSRSFPALAGKCVLAMARAAEPVPDDEAATTWTVGASPRVAQAPIVVGTIDQCMLSIMRVRDAWMRSWLLNRHLLVIDEVHASDPYMMEIVSALVRRHTARGGYATLMSATLGEELAHRVARRKRLPLDQAIDLPYPALTLGSGEPRYVLPSRHKLVRTVIANRHRCVSRAMTAIRNGEVVLWICSTVQDAILTYQGFVDEGVNAFLHHSRFTNEDRRILDGQVEAWIGKGGHRRAGIIVATQTCEQSLDIDADLLISEPCPADVMLQRFGRIGRHRPDLEPEAWIIDPIAERGWDAYLKADGSPFGTHQRWAWVYDPLSVRATIDGMRDREVVLIPEDARGLVEQATHEDALRAVARAGGDLWELAWKVRSAVHTSKRDQGMASLIDDLRPYANSVVNGVLSTRLGVGTVTLNLDRPMRGKVPNDPVTASEVIQVPYRWLGSSFTPEAITTLVSDSPDHARIEIAEGRKRLALHYDRRGLSRVTDLVKWNLI